MNHKVLILVPYKVRDFGGYTLVAWHLKRKYNIETQLTNAYNVILKLAKYKPDLYVVDHLTWDFKVEELKFCKENYIITCMYPTEGMVMRPHELMLNAGQHHDSEKVLDYYFAWGIFHKRLLNENDFMVNTDKIKIIGTARFDFYNNNLIESGLFWSKADFEAEHKMVNKNAPILLWATSTPYAARDKDEIIKRYTSRSTYTVEEIEWVYNDNQAQLSNNLKVIEHLAIQHPDWNIVIKVHPAEWLNPYNEIVSRIPNVYLASNRVITDYLAHTDLLLQRNCTTSTEAWIMGLPVIQMELKESPDPFFDSHRKMNDVTYTPEEADNVVTSYINGASIPLNIQEEREVFITELYYKVDGRSSERMADLINELVNEKFKLGNSKEEKNLKLQNVLDRMESEKNASNSSKLKKALGIPQKTSLKFWKLKAKKERKGQTGVGEMEITQDMVDQQFELYDSCLTEIFLQ
ncbi:MAG: hypothetical protein SGJ04_01310 [Bacteroidota bacterium]|nr:hypothetical protein [Bacteroidota bacterium]